MGIKPLQKKLIIAGACGILCVFVLAATLRIWSLWPAQLLLVPDVLHKADCIVMLQGDLYPRAKKSVELFAKGYAPEIVISPLRDGETQQGEYYYFEMRAMGIRTVNSNVVVERAFEYFGKDLQGVAFLPHDCTSTFDEAKAALQYMRHKGYTSMTLVTSTYHMSRALRIFRWVFSGSGIRIYPVTAPHPIFNPSRWWTKEADVEMISREYLAYIYNFIYHGILGKDRTDFDS